MKDRNIVVTQYSPPFVDDELGEVGPGCRGAGNSWLASSAPVKDFYFLSENLFHLFVSTNYPLGFEKELRGLKLRLCKKMTNVYSMVI